MKCKYDNAVCICGKGENDYCPIKPQTNFERVTASPEALAKWICEFTDFCDSGCSRCPVQEKCLYDSDGAGNKDNEQLLIEFLKEDVNRGEK